MGFAIISTRATSRLDPVSYAPTYGRAARCIFECDEKQDMDELKRVLDSECMPFDRSAHERWLTDSANAAVLEEYARFVAVQNSLPLTERFHVYVTEVA